MSSAAAADIRTTRDMAAVELGGGDDDDVIPLHIHLSLSFRISNHIITSLALSFSTTRLVALLFICEYAATFYTCIHNVNAP
jgi:hypothetical protein